MCIYKMISKTIKNMKHLDKKKIIHAIRNNGESHEEMCKFGTDKNHV